MKKRLAVMLTFLLSLACLPVYSPQAAVNGPGSYTVKVDTQLNVREKPNQKAKVIGTLKKGTRVYVYSTEPGGWAKIKYNNRAGYIASAYLVPIANATGTFKKEAIVLASPTLSVRATPSQQAKVMGKLKRGTTTAVYATDTEGWSEIRYNGKKAYVTTAHLKFKSRLTLKEAEQLILNSEPSPDKEIKMSYYEGERDVYRAKVGFKGTPYGYYFLIVDPDNGAMKTD
ncbi:hypothetical protein AC623_17360 [Bacillus sp. FJAT-27231]|uniref:SH3 domain-containing protein n=1 Tax=Bacillus sp. FJAT-27231 TaxID=1679168 RepID=UPI000670A9A0|nr:SH3 domain-containing protein [Bacillus sp. FJAT-27231]KMY55487.1 hypothetical protein AC623_17360 [Bacillus sp. FJAT-27231]